MDKPIQVAARKAAFMIQLSEQLLGDQGGEPGRRAGPPTFRWPSFVCGYEHSDDYYSEGHACELPVGHDGLHRCSLEWETRAPDVCAAQGHVWGEWQPLEHEWPQPFVIRAPTKQRKCSRCDRRDDDGEYNYPGLMSAMGTLGRIVPTKV